jgi:hypothetical protein
MARPQKIGLDYFPLDVNFYGDIKIRRLMRNNGGGKAAFVYVTLLCKIYESGYYMVWDDDMSFMLSDITGFEEGMIRECIKSCLQFGLLDKELFDSHAILTSKGIQLRYLSATRRRVETVSKLPFIYPELLDEFLCTKTDNKTEFMSTKTPLMSAETPLMSAESIESKVKERKVKHSSSVLQRAGAHTHTHT